MLCNFLNPCHPSRDQGIYFLEASDREEKVIRSLSRRTSLEPIAGLSQGNFKKTIRIAKECKSPKTVLPWLPDLGKKKFLEFWAEKQKTSLLIS